MRDSRLLGSLWEPLPLSSLPLHIRHETNFNVCTCTLGAPKALHGRSTVSRPHSLVGTGHQLSLPNSVAPHTATACLSNNSSSYNRRLTRPAVPQSFCHRVHPRICRFCHRHRHLNLQLFVFALSSKSRSNRVSCSQNHIQWTVASTWKTQHFVSKRFNAAKFSSVLRPLGV